MLTWLMELPLWIPIGLGVVGAILYWTGLNHQEKRLKLGAGIVVGVAVALGLFSYFFESDREICTRQTRELVSAIESRNWATVSRLLDEDFSILDWQGRDVALTTVKKGAENFDISNIRITGLTASKPAPAVIIQMRVWADVQKQPAGFTDWRLDWEKDGNKWLLTGATPLNEIPGVTGLFRGHMPGF